MRKFVRFEENNDWEGERWNFYIPVDGNGACLEHLTKVLENAQSNDGCPYSLYPDELTETEVDTLVKFSKSGYMDYENKLDGIMDPAFFLNLTVEKLDQFYKGSISDYIKTAETKT